jgi:hypothetical protein
MIRRCDEKDFEAIWQIINDGAQAYHGVILPARWKKPYLSQAELRHEMCEGVALWAYEEHGELTGVVGISAGENVTLIRHAYVRTRRRRAGIGA